jgi:glycosyltransferase involved in cell wall biosynthesis
MKPLSVVVTTSAGREIQLQNCLKALCSQRFARFEVIIADDGSAQGQWVAADFKQRLELDYLWRPQDECPARSRNLGAQAASGQQLVFIDSDLLLNPQALAAYAEYLAAAPGWLLYGYAGTELELVAESALQSGVQVNWRDKRFGWNAQGLYPLAQLFHSPYENAYSLNFALARSTYQAIGGFDEGFSGWGGEDLDFAERAVSQGLELHFLLDAWGEHQQHERSSAFHARPAEQRGKSYVFRPHAAVGYGVKILGSLVVKAELEGLIQQHYQPSKNR